MKIKNGNDLIDLCNQKNIKLYELMLEYEMINYNTEKNVILNKLIGYINIMKDAVKKAFEADDEEIKAKIIGGEAKKLKNRYEKEKTVCGYTMAKAISYALGVIQVNASMGKIIAAPTAGSCGVLPAALLSIEETYNLSEENLVQGLLTASAIGLVIAKNASLSGAEGGCQAEVGSAAAMASAAAVEILGGSVTQALDAAAIALKNLMGLICDPIGGLVEAPCSKRNAIGTANALIAAEMSLAGIKSVIPFDEVVIAMNNVGNMLPCALRETAQGGIAVTPTGKRIKKEIFG